MQNYLTTFHTHFSALQTDRCMKRHGINARLSPVPRQLSTDCGTCLRYEAETPCIEWMHMDYEAVYYCEAEGEYQLVKRNEL